MTTTEESDDEKKLNPFALECIYVALSTAINHSPTLFSRSFFPRFKQ